jgi:hypothetical protein
MMATLMGSSEPELWFCENPRRQPDREPGVLLSKVILSKAGGQHPEFAALL